MPYANKDRQLQYQKDWMKKRRAKWLADNGPCARCGSAERLEVDHIDPKSKVDHKVWTWSTSRMLKELSKCQVLCYVCHKAKHAAPHGSQSMYRHHACRCIECRAWNAAATRTVRERRRLIDPYYRRKRPSSTPNSTGGQRAASRAV